MKLSKSIMIEILVVIIIIGLGIFLNFKLNGSAFVIALLGLILIVVLVSLIKIAEKNLRDSEVSQVRYYVNQFGEDMFTNMPVGIVAINSSGIIMWSNDYFNSFYEDEPNLQSINELFPNILKDIEKNGHADIEINESVFKVLKRGDGLYFFDNTQCYNSRKLLYDNRLVFGVISFDNYEDYSNSLDDQRLNEITLYMSKLINMWSSKYDLYLKKYTSSRYIVIARQSAFDEVVNDKFYVLDQVRAYGNRTKLPLTISMSFAGDILNVSTLAEKAFDGLDLVLNRGGDQAVVKYADESAVFYGGKTDAFAKNSRSKVRMFSSSIANSIKNSKNIVIMGHSSADFDSIGSCIGMCKIALNLNKNVTIALDVDKLNNTSKKLIEEIKDSPVYQHIKSCDDALKLMTSHTLVIVCDTHRASLVESQEILNMSRNTVVIDHHRRGEDFIKNLLLTYIEPYASSTSELVTELLQFQLGEVEITPQEATALLGGIIVDTKHFVFRTSNRTFDAAATLQSLGADTVLIQDLLKEELDTVVTKNNLISKVKVIGDNCAVTFNDGSIITRELLAQTADELLQVENIRASFVVGNIDDETVALSARSSGDFNVQIIAESFGGGGHMTSAAAQINDMSVSEFIELLIEKLNGGDKNEGNLS